MDKMELSLSKNREILAKLHKKINEIKNTYLVNLAKEIQDLKIIME